MATGQDLLDRMELLNQELQLQSGEIDVTKGLLALNVAQDYFETRAALRVNIMGSSSGSVTTTQNVEYTAFPSGVLRIDGMQFVDATTSLPAWDLVPIQRTGGHRFNAYWPQNLISTSSTGKPRAYWTNGSRIFWDPLPSDTHTIRYYGFAVASNLTAAGTFAYPDIVMLPLASFAARLMKSGVDDPQVDIAKLAEETFEPVLDALSLFQREQGLGFTYKYSHDT